MVPEMVRFGGWLKVEFGGDRVIRPTYLFGRCLVSNVAVHRSRAPKLSQIGNNSVSVMVQSETYDP